MSVEIFPFSFLEYLTAAEIFKAPPVNMGSQTVARLRNAVANYIEQGGFPEILTYDVHDRIHVLQSYVDSVVLRDVIERHGTVNLLFLGLNLKIRDGQNFSTASIFLFLVSGCCVCVG